MRVAGLMACHNRRHLTETSIERVLQAAAAVPGLEFRIYLVDDGSSDGTADLVRMRFPDVVVIPGTGALFWAGAMGRAFRRATEDSAVDAFLMINDDVLLDVEAATEFLVAGLGALGKPTPEILVGKTMDLSMRTVTYAGFDEISRYSLRSFKRVTASEGHVERCDTFNANFVLVPGEFLRSVGGLDPAYRHGGADLDLGLVARDLGVEAYVWPIPIGVCEAGPPTSVLLRQLGRRDRARALFVHPHGLGPDLHFAWKHRPRWLLPAYAAVGTVRRLRQLLPAQTGNGAMPHNDPKASER